MEKEKNKKTAKMKKIINRILIFIKALFSGFKRFYRDYGIIAIDIVDKVRAAIDSPAADALVNLTKTDIDNRALILLRNALSRLYTHVPPPQKQGVAEHVLHYLDYLKNSNPEMRGGVLLGIGSLILRDLANSENLSKSDADTLIQVFYKGKKEGKLN